MGRPEKLIITPNRELRRLACWLRTQRAEAGLSYRQMQTRTTVSAATLSRAASGAYVPRLPVVEAYARACDASAAEARRLWRLARYTEHRQTHPRTEPHPLDFVREPADMSVALRHLYYRSGAMPLEEIERRSGGYGTLPHTTMARMLRGMTMLQMDQLRAFLEVCEVPPKQRVAWVRAWSRAWRSRERERERERERVRLQPQRHPSVVRYTRASAPDLGEQPLGEVERQLLYLFQESAAEPVKESVKAVWIDEGRLAG